MAGKVRAKFRLNSYTTELHSRPTERDEHGNLNWAGPREQVEKRTLNFTPVYSGDNSENERFWEATPSGSIQLGCVNPEAWEHFEIGKEYFLDFTPAE